MSERADRPGDTLAVTLREVSQPRTIEVPLDLVAALDDARVREPFDAMSYSHRTGWMLAVNDAKRPETRRKHRRGCVAAMVLRAAR